MNKSELILNKNEKGLGIILHSGSYDRVYHGLTIAATASAMEQEVKLFFTYWSLEYLKKRESFNLRLDSEGIKYKNNLEKFMEKGHLQKISELITLSKSMGVKIYVCTGSMALLNIERDDLIDEVDNPIGLATFLDEIEEYQFLFI